MDGRRYPYHHLCVVAESTAFCPLSKLYLVFMVLGLVMVMLLAIVTFFPPPFTAKHTLIMNFLVCTYIIQNVKITPEEWKQFLFFLMRRAAVVRSGINLACPATAMNPLPVPLPSSPLLGTAQ